MNVYKILIIEDEEYLRSNLLERLSEEGYITEGAADGIAGLEIVCQFKPDLIICDVTLPLFDGYEVLSQIRKDPYAAKIPFIFLTARTEQSEIRRGMNLGADDYLTKPFSGKDLLGAIAARLARRNEYVAEYADHLSEMQNELCYLQKHDCATDLPNTEFLKEWFEEVKRQIDNKDFLVGVLVIGIDRFNGIVDSMGGVFANALQRAISERLSFHIEPGDVVALASQGVFAIVLAPIPREQELAPEVNRILEAFKEPFHVERTELYVTASIGASVYPDNADDVYTLIECAHSAMEVAQKTRSSNHVFFSKSIKTSSSEQLSIDTDLNNALKRNELRVYYQPQVDVLTGQIAGAEALVRWQHPEKGLIQPVDFIPIAEETGTIVKIGEWVLSEACKQTKKWVDVGLSAFVTSVNISGRQFGQRNLHDVIKSVINNTGISPKNLGLELTEGTIVQEPDVAVDLFDQMKNLGVKVCVDDFGIGYSSLNYLKQFNFDTLKIDRSFIRHVNTDDHNAALTTVLMQMAKLMKLETVAEGVEKQEEFAFLKEKGCNKVQGYLFSKPLPVDEFEKLLIPEISGESYFDMQFDNAGQGAFTF